MTTTVPHAAIAPAPSGAADAEAPPASAATEQRGDGDAGTGIDARIEARFRALLVEALRRAELEQLLCAHEQVLRADKHVSELEVVGPAGLGPEPAAAVPQLLQAQERPEELALSARPDLTSAELQSQLGEILPQGLPAQPSGVSVREWLTSVSVLLGLVLTSGFFWAHVLGLAWWWYAVSSLVSLGALGVAVVVLAVVVHPFSGRVQEAIGTAAAFLVMLFWPATAIYQVGTAGWSAFALTHLLPFALAGAAVLVVRGAHGVLRLLVFVRHMPALLVATLGILLIPLFSTELWQLATETGVVRGALLFGAVLLTIAFLMGRVWQAISEPVGSQGLQNAVDRISERPAKETRDEALAYLRSLLAPWREATELLGTGHGPFTLAGTAAPGPSGEPHPQVLSMLESAFQPESLVKRTSRHLGGAAGAVFGGRQLLLRLLFLVSFLSFTSFLIFYAVVALVVDVEVGESWARGPGLAAVEIAEWRPLSALDVSFPLGPYLWLPLFLALVETALALTFILRDPARLAGLLESLSGEIRRCLLIAAPYYRLPMNDAFATWHSLRGHEGTTTLDNCRNEGPEDGERPHAGHPAHHSLWYRWTAPRDGVAEIVAEGSALDSVVAVYRGTRLDQLAPVDGDDGSPRTPSRVSFGAKEGVDYVVAVDGHDGATGSMTLRWALSPLAPPNDAFAGALQLGGPRGAVRGSNVGATKEPGEPEHAGSAGGASIWYSWRAPADGSVTIDTEGSSVDTLLAVYTGRNLRTLSVAAVRRVLGNNWSLVEVEVQAGQRYWIAVDGYEGATGELVLAWAGDERILDHNDAFAAAAELTGAHGTTEGWNGAAGKEPGEPEHAGNPGGASIWYRWRAPAAGRVTFETAGSQFVPLLGVYTGRSVDALTEIASSRDRAGVVSFDAQAGESYAIAVDGRRDDSGEVERGLITLRWLLPPPNDAFAAATELKGIAASTAGWNSGATWEPGEPAHAGNPAAASVWYRWRAAADGRVTMNTQNSDFDTVLAVYTGSVLAELEPVASNDDTSATDRSSAVGFPARARETYRIAVDGHRGATGDFVLSWELELPPANDDFEAAQELEGESGKVLVKTKGATKQTGEPDHAGNSGGASVWCRWTAPVDGQVVLSTEGSSFDTLLAVYQGATLPRLSEVAANDDAIGRQSRVRFAAVQGETYLIAVDGFGGETGDLELQWALERPPANDDFASAEPLEGRGGTTTATTGGATKEPGEADHAGNSGGSSIWYSWTAPAAGTATFDTVGSDFDTLLAVYGGPELAALELVAANDDAVERQSRVSFAAAEGIEYRIAVDGYGGSSGDCVLNWRLEEAPRRPDNDDFAAARQLAGPRGSVTGRTEGATREPGEREHAGKTGGASVWLRWEAPADGRYTFATAGSSFDTLLAVYTGARVDQLSLIASNDDAAEGERTSRVTFTASAGTTYAIAVDGYNGATGELVLSWDAAGAAEEEEPPAPEEALQPEEAHPANDDFAAAETLAGPGASVRTSTTGATREPRERQHGGRPGGASVWYRWIAPADGRVTFETTGSDFDTLLAVYTGPALGQLSLVATNDDASESERTSRVAFGVQEGVEYRIAVDGADGETGDLMLRWELEPA